MLGRCARRSISRLWLDERRLHRLWLDGWHPGLGLYGRGGRVGGVLNLSYHSSSKLSECVQEKLLVLPKKPVHSPAPGVTKTTRPVYQLGPPPLTD
jgi:hypothetical protein